MRRHKIPCDCGEKDGEKNMAVLCNTWGEYFIYWCRHCCRQIKMLAAHATNNVGGTLKTNVETHGKSKP